MSVSGAVAQVIVVAILIIAFITLALSRSPTGDQSAEVLKQLGKLRVF
jgi:hypothetical protein